MNEQILEDAISAGLLHIPESHKGKPLEQPTYGTMLKLAKFAELTKARANQWIDCSVELPKHGTRIVGANSKWECWNETFHEEEPLGSMVYWLQLPPNAQQPMKVSEL